MDGWEDPRRVLERHGLRPKRAFSQNFLVSRHVVEAIARAVAPSPGETVVELGPGLGTLTGALLATGARVVAVERDREMLAVLAAELGQAPRLVLVPGDAASFDLASAAESPGQKIAVAGNLPYAITGAILRNLCAQAGALRRAVVMVQKEVRDRLVAFPGSAAHGALTVFVQARFEVRRVIDVRAGSFHPPPRVDSAVVELVPRAVPRAEESPAFVRLVHAAFQARRKTLRNAMLREWDEGTVARALGTTGIDGQRRGETLEIEELAALAVALGS